MRETPVLSRSSIFQCGLWAVLCVCLGCDNLPPPAFTQLADARRLTAELASDLSNSANATNRAVMADTEQVAAQFAEDSRAQTQTVEHKLNDLETMLRGLHYSAELALLGELRQAFERSRALDAEILGLAVESTNLKAQRLSFGAGAEAADAFRRALEALPADAVNRVLILTAILGVREVQVLEAPHIAAAEDEVMNVLEQRMAVSAAATRDALGALALHMGEPALEQARVALERFMEVHSKLLALSRRNSNVRSLALALGQKRTLTASCEGLLQTLGERLSKYEYPARR
jgi:hypothetical protein